MKKISTLKNLLRRFARRIRQAHPASPGRRLSGAFALRPALLASLVVVAGMASLPVRAVTIMTQTFTGSWTIEPYDYANQTSAWAWSYTPYTVWDSSLGTLTEVRVHTTVNGTRVDAGDALFLRSSFFTGWAPDHFQHYLSDSVAPGQPDFSYAFTKSYTGATLDSWVNPMYLPDAYYYIESRTYGAGHTISQAVTTLEYIYEANPVATVPDAGGTALILSASLGAVALLRKSGNTEKLKR